jgi:hypothetical protein
VGGSTVYSNGDVLTAIHREANYLDANRPNWYNEINVPELDMLEATQCVGGQLDWEGTGNGNFYPAYCWTMPMDANEWAELALMCWEEEIFQRREGILVDGMEVEFEHA